ncbi:hypothetical protein ACFWN7_08160 [Agromyces sp. NPDC058484]|uniref:hypothetical protein n=1 Tax=Agromyces sp. NPDC058484 TaxID=3346524 RepID=UPI00365B2F08
MPGSASEHLDGDGCPERARSRGERAMTADGRDTPHPHDDLGGDPACWLGRVCPECGAMIEGPIGRACWTCGATPRAQEAYHG